MEKTLIGKDGYLFLQNDSAKELEIHCDNLCLIENKLDRYDKYKEKYLLLVFPDKSYIYKDKLPDGYDAKYRPALDIYHEYLGDHLFDTYDILKNEKDIYYKTDTHINLKGNIIVYNHFVNKVYELFGLKIKKQNIQLIEKKVDSLSKLGLGIGDLTWPSNLGNQLLNSTKDIYYYSNQIKHIYTMTIDKNIISLLTIDNNQLSNKTDDNIGKSINWNILSKYILYKKNDSGKQFKILFFYDSFLVHVLPLFWAISDEVYLCKKKYNNDIIDLIKPDYVFEFKVERFLF